MNIWLFLPPVLFLVFLVVAWLQYRSMAFLSAGEEWKSSPGKLKPYACGEDYSNHRVQPDYSQFFPFAFFFTIMHVVALMVATVPFGEGSGSILAAGYLLCAGVGLFILFRR